MLTYVKMIQNSHKYTTVFNRNLLLNVMFIHILRQNKIHWYSTAWAISYASHRIQTIAKCKIYTHAQRMLFGISAGNHNLMSTISEQSYVTSWSDLVCSYTIQLKMKLQIFYYKSPCIWCFRKIWPATTVFRHGSQLQLFTLRNCNICHSNCVEVKMIHTVSTPHCARLGEYFKLASVNTSWRSCFR